MKFIEQLASYQIFQKFFRLMYNQLNEVLETIFSGFLTGLRKNHNTQYDEESIVTQVTLKI